MKKNKKFKKNKANKFLIQDIKKVSKNKPLLLRKDPFTIEVSRKALKKIITKYKVAIPVIIFIIIFLTGTFFYKHITHADIAILFPATCLGGWTNTQNAANKPDNDVTVEDDAFTVANSATLAADRDSQLFCGNFTGITPSDTVPSSIILSLSGTAKEEPTSSEQVPISSTADLASTTQQILNTPDGNMGTVIITDVPVSTSTQSSSAPLPTANPEATPDPSPSTEDTSIQSLLSPLIPLVYADEIGTTTDVASSSSDMSYQSTTTISSVETPEDIIEVFYTFDGQHWHSLGKISKSELKTAQFQLPVDEISSWEDLNSLQISIARVKNVDAMQALYIDGMQLNVQYEKVVHHPNLPLSITNVKNKDREILRLKPSDPDGLEDKIFMATNDTALGGLAIYNIATKALVLTTNVTDATTYSVSSTYLGAGTFDVIRTTDPNLCSQRSLDDCESYRDAVGESEFTIEAVATATSTSSSTSILIQ
ncbi:MAG TPA: hypothetical protein VGT41_05975 [Candidatus Babeliales bacterium]|nr:hypothetical protein [Candidatus Babeliales bacterium]